MKLAEKVLVDAFFKADEKSPLRTSILLMFDELIENAKDSMDKTRMDRLSNIRHKLRSSYGEN